MSPSSRDPLRFRRRILLGVWLLSGAAILARAGQVQIVQGEAWREAALAQHRTARDIPAPRGRILDREGVPLAETRELFEVAVAPHEARAGDPDATVAALEAAGVSSREARRAVRSDRSWVYLGEYSPTVRMTLQGADGVHLSRKLRRDYPQGRLALGILGAVREERGAGGVEQTFDEHLRGLPGRSIVAKGPSGELRDGQVFEMEAPRPGGDLVLTLDADLQAIAKGALADQVRVTNATGGDLLITDPFTGEILAAVSLRGGEDVGVGFLTEPVEPGSTMKPFALATLLSRGVARVDDLFDTRGGRLAECGHVISDISDHGVLSLGEAVEVSSNVAMGLAVKRLDPVEQYEGLRDFGFGQRTGIPIPGESAGRLRRPDEWTCPSSTAHAIGYEISATPLQTVMAYGALANGGRLMEPRIVREIRDPEGRRETLEPRIIRRVLRRSVARTLTDVLVGVVDHGTGQSARLESFTVAGKSGTARAFGNGGYDRSHYFASFVGYFPADEPQLVIYTRLNGVESYGGAAASPVTRAVMEAALASRGTPLRMTELDEAARTGEPEPRQAAAPATPNVIFASAEPARPAVPRETDREEVARAWSADRPLLTVQVPDLAGMSVREAARRLHTLGLRVTVAGAGVVEGTRPGAGRVVQTGDTVLLRTGRGER